jgi:hypothetical protein
MRRWLVLVAPPAQLFASWLAYRSVRDELCRVSARDDFGGICFVIVQGVVPRCSLPETGATRLQQGCNGKRAQNIRQKMSGFFGAMSVS